MQAVELFPVANSKHPETALRRADYKAIAGVDEVGRGCLAGPVVAAAVILHNLHAKFVAEVNDSKKVKPAERERLDRQIRKWAVAVAVAEVPNTEIDEINILQASFKAMRLAVAALPVAPDYVLVDGHMKIPALELPQTAIVQGDARSKSIGAASIVAKVYRDRLMARIHEQFPHYNFKQNKGYGTREHWEALSAHGPCHLHRFSFQGVAGGERGMLVQLELDEL